MKTDPLCIKCQKTCKQRRPAFVVSCAKYTPSLIHAKPINVKSVLWEKAKV